MLLLLSAVVDTTCFRNRTRDRIVVARIVVVRAAVPAAAAVNYK